MSGEELLNLMNNPSLMTRDTVPALKEMTEKYPWFAAPKLLYLKNLAQVNHLLFAPELKKMAIALPDRKKLYLYIHDDLPVNMDFPAAIDVNSPDGFSLIDNFLSARSGQDETMNIQPSVSTDYMFWTYTHAQEGNDEKDVKFKHHELIDSFLSEEMIRPVRPSGDDSTGEVHSPFDETRSLDDSYFTETLARIYIKQKRYERALQIIKNLSLKYPEKNVYFADQIRFLEKLIINNTKK